MPFNTEYVIIEQVITGNVRTTLIKPTKILAVMSKEEDFPVSFHIGMFAVNQLDICKPMRQEQIKEITDEALAHSMQMVYETQYEVVGIFEWFLANIFLDIAKAPAFKSVKMFGEYDLLGGKYLAFQEKDENGKTSKWIVNHAAVASMDFSENNAARDERYRKMREGTEKKPDRKQPNNF